MKTKQTLFLPAMMLFSALGFQLTAAPVGTAFTYQGRLNNGGNPASGIYDLRFAIYDAEASGAQIGNAITNAATGVSNGLFTVALDFGSVFDGNARWLEIAVRTNGGGAFTSLAPRQQLTPAPYAHYSPNAGVAASASSVAAANISGTIPLAKLPAAVVTNNASGVALTGSFSGSGSGLTGITTGGLADNSVTASKLATDAASLLKVSGGAMSSSGTSLSLSVNEYLNDKDLYVHNDAFHGLGWYGYGKLFGDANVNGPVLYGFDGGGLGSYRGAGFTNLALLWTASGNVGIGKNNPATALDVNGTVTAGNFALSGPNYGELKLRNDDFHGLGWYGTGKLFAGLNINGPVLYGGSGGALGATGNGPLIALAWNNNGNVGIGTTSPDANLMINGSAYSGAESSFVGTHIRNTADGGDTTLWLQNSSKHAFLRLKNNYDTTWLKLDDGTHTRMAIDTSGNVGITTPGARLEVNGNALLNGIFANLDVVDLSFLANSAKMFVGWNLGHGPGETDFIANRGPGSVGGFGFYDVANDATVHQLMSLTGGGSVGIGTALPYAKLHVQGAGVDCTIRSETTTANAAGLVEVTAPGGHGALVFGGSSYPAWGGPLSLNLLNASDGPITFGHFLNGGPYERMRITSAGNIGIGVNDPSALLEVGGRIRLRGDDVSQSPGIYLWNTVAGADKGFIGMASSDTMGLHGELGGGWGLLMNVTNGNVGLGGSPGADKLDIQGSTRINDSDIYLRSGPDVYHGLGWYGVGKHFANVAVDGPVLYGYSAGGLGTRAGAGTNMVLYWNCCSVGIGTTSPTGKLSVNGSANNLTGVWGTFSDKRLKDHIEPMAAGSLERLLRLEGVTFEYNKPELQEGFAGVHRGWIAQDVEQVFPEWVSEAPDGMKMVTPVGFNALTVEALRELRAEKDEQLKRRDAEIAELKQIVGELKALVGRLAQKLEGNAK